MIKLKMFTAAALALIIFASFLMTHVAAEPNQFYEYMADEEKHYFFSDISVNDSYARVYCTNPGWNEETYTDFEAQTYAKNVYFGTEADYEIEAYIDIGMYYDYEQFWINDENSVVSDGDFGVTAELDGMDLIDMDHGIDVFSTNHEIYICYYDYTVGEYVRYDQYGPMIIIGTSY